ncbi:hypothetical protein JKP88DRAFT_247322 [Tribonema minus]|uniref:Uncharacterized protein n=1 Tax=Tribonema minus TaxID=303371 RepID=A0A836CBJ8_9STRA|nr:hypothetical protein JKP88DRAFT_247322 [Tribonema minus]
MPIGWERQHGTRTSAAEGDSPLIGSLFAKKAMTTARGPDDWKAGRRLSVVHAVAEVPLQPVSRGDRISATAVPPVVLRQAAPDGVAPFFRAPVGATADDDRQPSVSSSSARSSIASGGFGLAAETPRSMEQTSVHGVAVGTGNDTRPTYGYHDAIPPSRSNSYSAWERGGEMQQLAAELRRQLHADNSHIIGFETASAPRSAPAAPVAASSSTRTVTGDACTPPRAGLCIQHAAMQRGDPLDVLKPDARAQLDGAARQARHPATYMLMQQSPTQIRLAEQRQSEALTEAALRQRAHQRQEELSQLLQQDQLNAQALLQQREINTQQRALDAQQAALLAEQACLRAEWRALEHASVRSRAGRDANSVNAPSQGCARYGGGSSGGGGDSGGSGSSGGGGDSGGSNSSDGGGGSGGGGSGGGDGDGGGGSTSGATVSHYGDNNSACRASVTAAAPAAEVDLAGFDASGYAIMRFAVTLDEKQFPKAKVDQGNVSALTSLQKQLPGKFRSAALALRQKQQPLWPALRNADDFGCEWFNTAVYSVVSCIANGSGDHPRLGMLARQASSWETQGGEQGLRDGALLSWLFTKIGKFLEIAEPTSVAANLMNWSLRQGLALKLFIIEFSDAAHTATLLDNSLDHIVVTALLRIVRHHYPNISGA